MEKRGDGEEEIVSASQTRGWRERERTQTEKNSKAALALPTAKTKKSQCFCVCLSLCVYAALALSFLLPSLSVCVSLCVSVSVCDLAFFKSKLIVSFSFHFATHLSSPSPFYIPHSRTHADAEPEASKRQSMAATFSSFPVYIQHASLLSSSSHSWRECVMCDVNVNVIKCTCVVYM